MSIRGKVDFMGPGFLLETKYVSNLTPVQLVSVCLVALHVLIHARGHTVLSSWAPFCSIFTFL
jgi:hypothetical protein